jgi:hypothetical protein
MSEFSINSTTREPDLETAMKVVYQWNYDSEVEELRRLYVKGLEAQWIAERDLNWDRPIDQASLASTPLGIGFPIEQTSYWKSLSEEKVWELKKRMAAFRLSNFLHGEQGALMVAAQLVNAVPQLNFTRLPKLWMKPATSRSSRATSRSSTWCGQSRPI